MVFLTGPQMVTLSIICPVSVPLSYWLFLHLKFKKKKKNSFLYVVFEISRFQPSTKQEN